jgi:hypothetical protein
MSDGQIDDSELMFLTVHTHRIGSSAEKMVLMHLLYQHANGMIETEGSKYAAMLRPAHARAIASGLLQAADKAEKRTE